MRRYLQALGRILYTRPRSQMPVNTPTSEPLVQATSAEEPVLQPYTCAKSGQRPKPIPVNEDLRNLPDVETPRSPWVDVSKPEEQGFKDEGSEQRVEPPKKPMLQSTFDQLFHTMGRSAYKPMNKVTVVGAGGVGMATVFSLLAKGITNDISIVDFNEEKLKGELMDFQFGSKFLPNARIRASKDYAISSDSAICVLAPCAESNSMADEDGDTILGNSEMLKAVVPQLLKYSPDTILLVAIDPVDVLSYITWRVSDLPKGRVLGTGTNLSSATFRYLLADRLGLNPCACKGYIIGENGESGVPVWSSVTVGGVHLQDLNPAIGTQEDPEDWAELYRKVRASELEVRQQKGGTSWASALSIADICASILNDANCIRPLSTYVKGEHGIPEEVYLSLPCVVGSAGVTDIIRQPLTDTEMKQLHRSANLIASLQGNMKIVQ